MNHNKSFIILGCLGVLLLAFVIVMIISGNSHRAITLLSGAAGGWIAVGFGGYYYRKKHPEKFKKELVSANDERLNVLRGKAAYSTFFVTLVLIGVLIYVSWVIETFLMLWLLIGFLFFHIITLYFFYALYLKKY